MAKKNPVAFMSYAHLDNKKEQLTAFSELLTHEVLVQTGDEFSIFQDRKDIKWGQNWSERIEESLDRVTFLITFITPSFFKSEACRTELRRFLKREDTLGRNDLILPVYYVDCKQFGDEELLEKDELARAIFTRQYIDWRDLRFQPIDSLQVSERMSQLAAQIRDALWRVKESEGPDGHSISQQFAEQIKDIAVEEAYSFITKYTADLLSSARISLMVQDENQSALLVRAAIGSHANTIISAYIPIDDGISGSVARSGRPLVVSDISLSEYKQAPKEHGYNTKSFLCFPIILRGKSSFILNFTDKADGGPYNQNDLRNLEAIAPHIALALDRAQWYEKALEALSVEELGTSETPIWQSGPDKRGRKVNRRDGENADPHLAMFSPTGTPTEASARAVTTLCDTHGIKSLALLLHSDDSFYPICVTGVFEKKSPRVALKPKEIKLLLAATKGNSIAVPADGLTGAKHKEMVELFPLVVGEEVKGALLAGDADLSDEQRAAIAAFCRDISMPLELSRLREELERRIRTATQLRAFTDVVNTSGPEDAYITVLRYSAELLKAERGSLLLFDERTGELSVKAAIGPRAEVVREARVRIGEGIAGVVMREGRPLVVRDVSNATGLHPASAERSYKTKSFISYPITIGGRKVGVLNLTDKAGGGAYDELDLNLLDMIAPQMALALDRIEWHSKATQFQLLSITDPLTGLVNRRYLEERLQEELERSKRHRFAMSFMMVDIDDFKNYNDAHGHQAGDLALEMTAQCLKTVLRSVDVVARYGGEEFVVLLPQADITEALQIGERIRRRVERTQFPHARSQPLGTITVSIGVSAFSKELDTPAEIIYAADQALHIAKSQGKNCVRANR